MVQQKTEEEIHKLDDEFFQTNTLIELLKIIVNERYDIQIIDITIKRCSYINKNTGESHYLLDEYFGKYVLSERPC